jgi:hypothetical protein
MPSSGDQIPFERSQLRLPLGKAQAELRRLRSHLARLNPDAFDVEKLDARVHGVLRRVFTTSIEVEGYRNAIGTKLALEDRVRWVSRLEGILGNYASVEHAVASVDPPARRVLLVHGRDEGVLHAVARFLETLGLAVDVLMESPDKSEILLGKIEKAEPDLVLVLLTPDDEATDGRRARQNVVFELGYFMGRLGRDRVRLLTKAPVVLPSDIAGMLRLDLESGVEWRSRLSAELSACGFQYTREDLQKALSLHHDRGGSS